MWKNYNLFYTRILKSDLGLCFASENVHQIPKLQKTFLMSSSKESSTLKKTLLSLSGVQLTLNSKGFVVISQNSLPHLKIRKGQPLGAKITITGSSVLQFLYFFIFNVLNQLDLVDLLPHKRKNLDFTFLFQSFVEFPRLMQHFKFFRGLPSFRVFFSSKGNCKNVLFFLRFFKIPLKTS